MSGDVKKGLTRRGFSGLAAGGIAATALVSPAKAMMRSNAAPGIGLALYDARFSAPRAFAAMLREKGVKAQETGGDIAVLWFAGLRYDLGASVRRIAGMGRHNEFLLMQGLAAEKGLKPVFYAEHDFRGRGTFVHRLPQDDAALVNNLVKSEDWAAHVAQHLAASKSSARVAALAPVTAKASPAPDHPGLLVSWLFA